MALQPLWSVLHVVETSGLVTILHESFPQYMFDSKRSGEYHCDPIIHNQTLAQAWFDRIKSVQAQFNICGLESSYVPDLEIPNLNSRVEKVILPELFYACRYWASHLDHAEGSADVIAIERLKFFLSTQLLVWMEVMNLKKCIREGVMAIQQAEGWCKVSNSRSKEIWISSNRGRSAVAVLRNWCDWCMMRGGSSQLLPQAPSHKVLPIFTYRCCHFGQHTARSQSATQKDQRYQWCLRDRL